MPIHQTMVNGSQCSAHPAEEIGHNKQDDQDKQEEIGIGTLRHTHIGRNPAQRRIDLLQPPAFAGQTE